MTSTDSFSYDLVQKRRTWIKWLGASLIAGSINAAMFLALPTIIVSGRTEKFEVLDVHNFVEVIHIRHKEREPEKKSQPPDQEHEQIHPEKKTLPQNLPMLMPKLSLDFQLSPELPSAPGTLQFEPLEAGTFNLAGSLDGIDAAELDRGLIPLTRIPPVYPIHAKRRGLEGWVKVRFLVDEEGEVSDVVIIQAQPENVFDRSVLRCVKRWRFKPGTVEGIAVKAWGETTVKFELEN